MKKIYIQASAQVIKVKVADLSLHPTLAKIYTYADEDSIRELGNSMIEMGQQQPITINDGNEIVAGGRRWKAAICVNIEFLDAIVVDGENTNTALSMVYHNQHRTKSILEKINEAEILLELIGKNQGKRNDLLKQYDKLSEKGSRFAKAARVIGNISESSLRKLMSIVEFEKISPAHKNIRFIENMINKNISIDRVYAMMESIKPTLSTEKVLGKVTTINSVITPRLTTVPAHYTEAEIKNLSVIGNRPDFITGDVKLFNQSCIDMSGKVESDSVQVVFTSPPYSGLRNYNISDKELGREGNVNEYVESLISHLREVKRVLKKEGSFFLNIGETYKDKHAQLVPTKVLLALVEKEGWYLVNEIIWAKTNPITQSNVEKLQTSYEKIFHLVLDPNNYLYEEFRVWNDREIKIVKGPNDRNTKEVGCKVSGYTLAKPYSKLRDFIEEQNVKNIIKGHNASMRQKEVTALDDSVDHPALMPSYLPIIPILSTSKPGDIILDPFSGSGTTGKCAIALDRKYIGFELKSENFALSIKEFTRNEYVTKMAA